VVYGRFLDPEARKAFFEAYRDIESLWEILSPSPELRDHITTFKRLAQLYAAVRRTYPLEFPSIPRERRDCAPRHPCYTRMIPTNEATSRFETAPAGPLQVPC
jgi:hypothetical protein